MPAIIFTLFILCASFVPCHAFGMTAVLAPNITIFVSEFKALKDNKFSYPFFVNEARIGVYFAEQDRAPFYTSQVLSLRDLLEVGILSDEETEAFLAHLEVYANDHPEELSHKQPSISFQVPQTKFLEFVSHTDQILKDQHRQVKPLMFRNVSIDVDPSFRKKGLDIISSTDILKVPIRLVLSIRHRELEPGLLEDVIKTHNQTSNSSEVAFTLVTTNGLQLNKIVDFLPINFSGREISWEEWAQHQVDKLTLGQPPDITRIGITKVQFDHLINNRYELAKENFRGDLLPASENPIISMPIKIIVLSAVSIASLSIALASKYSILNNSNLRDMLGKVNCNWYHERRASLSAEDAEEGYQKCRGVPYFLKYGEQNK